MRKGILLAVLAAGILLAGAVAASAGTITWTLVETTGMRLHSPGTDNLLGTSDDGLSDKCNYTDASACAVAGNPSTGAYSFAKLSFVQTSSCAIAGSGHNPGDFCTQNSECGTLGICVDCNTSSGGQAYAYFAKNPSGGARGQGTLTADACEGSFDFTNISIGTSEVVDYTGGGCMTLSSGSGTSNTGCGVGAVSTNYSLDLWGSTIPNCGFPAGVMPGLALSGAIVDAGAGASSSVCGYTTAEIGAIITDAGLGSGDYLMITCGSGTLPTGLKSACLSGASWQAVMVAKTSTDVTASCADACGGGGCMAGTAEGVE